MSPLLLVLWREQHPQGHEQTMLQFNTQVAPPERVTLFTGEDEAHYLDENRGNLQTTVHSFTSPDYPVGSAHLRSASDKH